MSFLGDLLGAKEPLFARSIEQLEQVTHKQGLDVKLIGEIHEKAKKAIAKMRLDPQDSTGKEIYHALIAQIKKHDEHLASSIGGSDDLDVQNLLPLIKRAIDKVEMPRTAWVIRKSVARDMLRSFPPKNIMKMLNYRSVDSMLKRENLFEIYGALRFAESSEWLEKFNEKYKTLTPSDFETRKIEIVIMPQRWEDIAQEFIHKKKHNITHLKELGIILMLPIKAKRMPGITIWASSLLVHYTNEIRLYSSFFKTKQVNKNFGEILVETLIADPDMGPVVVGKKIHWRVIQRYFGKLDKEKHPEIFEPHVQPEDLHWRKAEEVLYKIDPELQFWQEMDYVALMLDGRPIPFNMLDVAASYCNETPYEERAIYHFRESLWNEIFARYMSQKTLETQILKELDNDMIRPERLVK